MIDAICMRLSAGIEVLARIDSPLRNSWQFMWGMRNRIAHGYLLVDSDIVRQTVEVDLPDIIRMIRREISDT